MSFLASLAVLATVLPQGAPAAQGTGQGAGALRAPLLTPAEQGGLRDKLVKYLETEEAYDKATALKDRERKGKARETLKEKFEEEWAKLEKKGNLLGSMADLRAIFENCFALKRPSFSLGQLRKEGIKEDGSEYSFFLPKAYDVDKPMRTVIVLPGTATADGAGVWTKAADYFAAVWDKSNAVNDTIFHVCHVPAGLELDPVPDFSRDGHAEEEDRRNQAVWSGYGQVMLGYNIDRARVFLDCGRGTCGFGLRFLTMFPDRFAGVVLRQPIDVADIRLGSLLGIQVLLLRTAATATAVDALKARLEASTPGTVTVLEATDDYPHRAATPAIEAWLQKHRRTMTPKKIVIEPNHDRFNRAYWAKMDRTESLLTAPQDSRPRLEVEADRATNRIVVKAQGVESFLLFLNDDLVDLDKEFTVVVNDKAVSEKRTRSFRDMKERMLVRRDWEYLFPVQYHTTVPKAAADKGDKKQ